jgi:hypothetical protein
LISVAAAKLLLELEGDEYDVALQALIDRATATLARELGRYLGPPAETVETHRTARTRLVVLYDDPVADSSVTLEGSDRPGDDYVAIDASEFAADGRMVRAATRFPSFVRATYTRGFAVDGGPADLLALIEELLRIGWEVGTTNAAMESETIGDYSYTRRDLEKSGSWQSVARGWRRGRA